jgi:hypothetical protein
MQDLMNMSMYEIRRAERQREMARINAHAWKSPRGRNGRTALAKALIALAARLAPTVPPPSTIPQA